MVGENVLEITEDFTGSVGENILEVMEGVTVLL